MDLKEIFTPYGGRKFVYFFNIGLLYEYVHRRIICTDKILVRNLLSAYTIC
jgi:hypothetical protein